MVSLMCLQMISFAKTYLLFYPFLSTEGNEDSGLLWSLLQMKWMPFVMQQQAAQHHHRERLFTLTCTQPEEPGNYQLAVHADFFFF